VTEKELSGEMTYHLGYPPRGEKPEGKENSQWLQFQDDNHQRRRNGDIATREIGKGALDPFL